MSFDKIKTDLINWNSEVMANVPEVCPMMFVCLKPSDINPVNIRSVKRIIEKNLSQFEIEEDENEIIFRFGDFSILFIYSRW